MVCRMGYIFLMMLTGLFIKAMVTIIKWLVAELQPYHLEQKPLKSDVIERTSTESSILFFNPSKLKSKLT